jgi:hypothetical protein
MLLGVQPEFSVAAKAAKAAATFSLMKKGTTLQFNLSLDEDIIGALTEDPER